MTENITSRISSVIHVSESEIAALYPTYQADWNEEPFSYLGNALWELGLDIDKPYQIQDVCQHRNRMNQVVTCRRYYGEERLDKAWLTSGFASKAAIDKSKNCKLLDELYRQRGLTEDVQFALETKDFYRDKSSSEE